MWFHCVQFSSYECNRKGKHGLLVEIISEKYQNERTNNEDYVIIEQVPVTSREHTSSNKNCTAVNSPVYDENEFCEPDHL